jgi:hypothetical protein
MATRTVRRNDLVGLTSLSFIRPRQISFTVTDTKPNTRLYAFFDGRSIDAFITPSGGSLGGNIVTNAAGSVSGTFNVPPMTFNTGTRVIRFQDSSVFDDVTAPGSTVGTASATFTASGLLQTFQETITNINIVENNILGAQPINDRGGQGGRDPLAQTFFTYGVKGGCFITAIDIFFQSKDSAIPVILEIREVVNGYPGAKLISDHSTVTLAPASVSTSINASAATKFTFSRPIYLEQDKEFCFVLLSNSNSYNVWTSELSKVSVETGKTIFQQPYVGSLFKSENNTTWTAQQTEDIKFTLYKAKFSVTSRDITFKSNSESMLVFGDSFSVTSGSAVVTANLEFQHGQKTGDKIYLTGIANGVYRGITSATISNVAGFTVTVIDDYTLTFNVGTNATSTGTLATSGILNSVEVDSAGSGYVAPVITIIGTGIGATASAVVVGGKITSVTVTNAGTGYTATPTYTLTDAAGVGAVLAPISEAIFVTAMNRKFQQLTPLVASLLPPETEIVNTVKTSNDDYVIGTHQIHPINNTKSVGKNAVIVNSATETASFGGNTSTEMILRMSTTNPNVSPLIDIGERPRLRLQNFLVNGKSNVASETTDSGTALSRYISKIITLATVSTGVRLFVNGASTIDTSFDVFIRTSLSTSSTIHTSNAWVPLNCNVTRDKSPTIDDFLDYEFYLDSISPFDVYDIKIVLSSEVGYVIPKIANYRTIILAT